MLVCGLVIFELAALIGLFAYALVAAKRKAEDFNGKLAALLAYLDKLDRDSIAIKNDIDAKFGPDLVEKLNAIFKLGEHPRNIVIGKDGKFHKANRQY